MFAMLAKIFGGSALLVAAERCLAKSDRLAIIGFLATVYHFI
jgi:hypothetical protein